MLVFKKIAKKFKSILHFRIKDVILLVCFYTSIDRRQQGEARPIGLKYEFKVRTLLDETIAFPAGKDAGKVNTTLALNETGAEIFSLLQEGKDEPAIVASLQQKYGADEPNLSAYVSAFLDKLRQAGILE